MVIDDIKNSILRDKIILTEVRSGNLTLNIDFRSFCGKYGITPQNVNLFLGLDPNINVGEVAEIWQSSTGLQLGKMLFDKFVENCGTLNLIEENEDLIVPLYRTFARLGLIESPYATKKNIKYMDDMILKFQPATDKMRAEIKAKADAILLDSPELTNFFNTKRAELNSPHNQYSLGDFILNAAAPRTSVATENRDDISNGFTDAFKKKLDEEDPELPQRFTRSRFEDSSELSKRFIRLASAAGYCAAAPTKFFDIRCELEAAYNYDGVETARGKLNALPGICNTLRTDAGAEVVDDTIDELIAEYISNFSSVINSVNSNVQNEAFIIKTIKSQYEAKNGIYPKKLQSLQQKEGSLEKEEQASPPQQTRSIFGSIWGGVIAIVLYPLKLIANLILAIINYGFSNSEPDVKLSNSTQHADNTTSMEIESIDRIMKKIELIHADLIKENEANQEISSLFEDVQQYASKDPEKFCIAIQQYLKLLEQHDSERLPRQSPKTTKNFLPTMQASKDQDKNKQLVNEIENEVTALRQKI